MKSLYKISFSLVSVCLIYLHQEVSASQVDKIDEYLVKKVGSDDITANLNATKEWLASGKNLDKSLTQTLQKFVLLSKVHDADRCDRNSHAILLANDKATGGFAHAVDPPKSRMARVVYNIASEHSENCKDVYIKTYSKIFGDLDDDKVRSVSIYMDDVIWFAKSSSRFIRNEFGIVGLSDELLWDDFLSRAKLMAFAAIDYLAKEDIYRDSLNYIEENDTGLKQAKLSHIPEMFVRYIIEPCEYFIKELGPDVFEPARYDKVLDQSSPEDKFRQDFYVSWARFRLCESLTKRDLKPLIKDVEGVFSELRI